VAPGRGALVVHRLVGRTTDDKLVFRGDRFARPDLPVPSAAVLGSATVVRQPPLHARLPRLAELGPIFRAGVVQLRRLRGRSR
jgi:hypothetical protein